MRKATTNGKIERRGLQILGVASLALTFAAFGCTTTRYGEPTSVSPSYGPMNHSVTPGSSSGTEGDTPMTSSYTGVSRVDTDVLATLAAEQGFSGRVLGPVNPGGVQTGVPIQPTGGQFVSPAMIANPQSTVNSSISSDPTPVISSGTTAAGVSISAAGSQAAATTATGTTIGTTATTAGTTSAVATTGALTTSTGSGMTVAGRGLAVTSSVTTARTTSTSAAVKTARVTSASKTTNVTMTAGLAPIRIEAGTQGQITVTNLTTTVPSTKPASTKP